MQEALRDRKDAIAEASSPLEIVIDEEKATVEAMKDEYRQSRAARLKELALEIELLVAEAAEAYADAKIEYAATLRELRAKQDLVAARLEELTKRSEEAWEELRVGVNGAMKEELSEYLHEPCRMSRLSMGAIARETAAKSFSGRHQVSRMILPGDISKNVARTTS